MVDDKFLSSVERKEGWYKSNKRETGDKALQSYLPSIGPPVVNTRPRRLSTGTTDTKRHRETVMSHQDERGGGGEAYLYIQNLKIQALS